MSLKTSSGGTTPESAMNEPFPPSTLLKPNDLPTSSNPRPASPPAPEGHPLATPVRPPAGLVPDVSALGDEAGGEV